MHPEFHPVPLHLQNRKSYLTIKRNNGMSRIANQGCVFMHPRKQRMVTSDEVGFSLNVLFKSGHRGSESGEILFKESRYIRMRFQANRRSSPLPWAQTE